jgi:competence protein ComEC
LALVTLLRINTIEDDTKSQGFKHPKSLEQNCKVLCQTKNIVKNTIYENYPSPNAELLIGLLVGDDELNLVRDTKEELKRTGTIHVAVVSGYNISLVYGFIFKLTGSPYKKRSLLTGLSVSFLYAIMTGAEPPVIRAWVMGSIGALAKYSGRQVDTSSLLTFTCLVMLSIDPTLLRSLSFQLSFLATYGLLDYSGKIEIYLRRLLRTDSSLVSDLSTSISAQMLVFPLISYHFGEVSMIGPFVNALLLWTVPLSTISGFAFVLSGVLLPVRLYSVSSLLSFPAYVSTDIFLRGVSLFSSLPFCSYSYKMSLHALCLYYVLLFFLTYLYKRRTRK